MRLTDSITTLEALSPPPARSPTLPALLCAKDLPVPMYRLLTSAEHAHAFVSGRIRLSTLSSCRTEGREPRRDPGEGSIVLKQPAVAARPHSAASGWLDHLGIQQRRMAAAQGAEHRIEDAFLLSMTVVPPSGALTQTFGRYCVEILYPNDLFVALTEALARDYALKRALFSRVNYCGREFWSEHGIPHHIAFLKPQDGYAGQQEARMLWELPSPMRLRPQVLHVPDAASLCRCYRV